jgi:hypothetical protein
MDLQTLLLLDDAAGPGPTKRLVPLTTDGRIFRQDGKPFRWRGVSAFKLLDRFARGENIQPFLDAYRGFNVLRVWTYTPANEWGSSAWGWPTADDAVRFVRFCAARGFYVELTLLLDDDPANVQRARSLLDALSRVDLPSLLIELANEPTTHKNVDTSAMKLDALISGFLFASGDYEVSARAFGHYLVAHTGRDNEWPRRAHDLLEYFGGGGPNAPEDPAHRCPCIADEPSRPDQAGYNVRDFLAYYGACSLLGAGATVHTETGKLAQLPTDAERPCIVAALAGLNAFPEDAPLWGYRRIDEHGQTLRTYVIGRTMVRVRPETLTAPEIGWIPIDQWGVLWRRS